MPPNHPKHESFPAMNSNNFGGSQWLSRTPQLGTFVLMTIVMEGPELLIASRRSHLLGMLFPTIVCFRGTTRVILGVSQFEKHPNCNQQPSTNCLLSCRLGINFKLSEIESFGSTLENLLTSSHVWEKQCNYTKYDLPNGKYVIRWCHQFCHPLHWFSVN